MTLDDEDIEAIAERVAAKLGGAAYSGWVDVESVAARLGVEPDWVYRRWRELGGIKLGSAKNSPVRFDLQAAVECAARLGEEDAPAPESPTRRRGRPRRNALEPGAELIRGRSGR
jgi:hypothetical protein